MNTDNKIEITGADLKELAKAAYDLSRPQGLGILHYEEGGLTDQEAESLIIDDERWPLAMDYVKGRACKMRVYKDGDRLYIHKKWYDHTDEQLKELLNRINS